MKLASFEENMVVRPAPWRFEKVPGGYAVRDAKGMLIAHVYGQDSPSGIGMTLDQAKEIASQIAKLAETQSPNRVKITSAVRPS
jgi:hypothetical protein